MKILGHTDNGDLIIQVSNHEWNSLQNGQKPFEDTEIKRREWKNSEASQFLQEIKNNRLRLAAIRGFCNLFFEGEFNGTLEKMRTLLLNNSSVRGIGSKTQSDLINILNGYETK